MEVMAAAAEPAERWTLQLPSAEKRLFGFPQSLREVVLLGMKYCDRVDAAMQDVASIADPAALCAALPLTGTCKHGRVSIGSDADLRCYFRAACSAGSSQATEPEPALRLVISSEASSGQSERTISPRTFVAMTEHVKGQESVRLNVGGTVREVHRMTAERIPLLAAMLRFPRATPDAPIFLDASPQAFDVLLEVARGRSQTYLDALEPSLRALVKEYAEYAGMEVLSGSRYHFKLVTVSPANGSAINAHAFITQGVSCTTGLRPQWNTAVGDMLVPQTGQTYWEVAVTSLGTAGREFMVGVVATCFTNLSSFLDSANSGWGVYHNSAGAVFLRANGSNQGSSYAEVFHIEEGTRIGILVDADRGTLLFFRNGCFKMSHMSSVKGQALLPAVSVYSDAVLTIRAGLPVPD